ncbi:GDSL-type esterase/lipase family protein [Citrobacter koseri]|uniref:GDSL-type esterase/lipase family protein n=1 Tax=Citrobacter koseri TaxID=545 RepID=UPI00397D3FE3
MTTYNTGNPLGSAAAKDLYDNAQNFDHLSNDQENELWPDRFGKNRLTWHGMEERYKTALANLGLNPVGTFQGGAVINSAGDIIQDEETGAWYRWDDLTTLPKTVPSGSTPESTGGTGKGKWLAVDVSDVLRKDLEKTTGAGLIGAYDSSGNASTVAEELASAEGRISGLESKSVIHNALSDIGSRLAAGQSVKIVVYGDSTVDGTNTTGWTANPTDGNGNATGGTDHNLTAPFTWPVYMQNILRDMFGSGATVKNAGYGGKTIIDDWAINNYQVAVVDTYGVPDYVFISFGLNDVARSNYTPELFYQKYNELIDTVILSGAIPVICTSDPVSFTSNRTTVKVQGSIVKAQKFVADRRGLQCIDLNDGLVTWQDIRNDNNRWAYHQNDGLHFSNLGHYKRAELCVKEISGLVIQSDIHTAIAPWQARQNVYPSSIFRGVNNHFSGCYNFSNQNNVEVLTWYVWSDRRVKLNYHSVDRDISALSTADVSSTIKVTNLMTGSESLFPVYFGTHGGGSTKRLSELPLECGQLNHGINKISYVTPALETNSSAVGFLSISSTGVKTVNVVGTPIGTAGAISANWFSIDDVMSHGSGRINYVMCQLNLPKYFGVLITKCKTFDNATDVTLLNPHSCLLLYRESDDRLSLYLVTYDTSAGTSVSQLATSSSGVYTAGMIVELRINSSSGNQVIQAYSNSTQLINYTHPTGSMPLPVGGIVGGIFAAKNLAASTDLTGYASISYS